MKLASFDDYRIGIVEDDDVFDVTAALPATINGLPAQRMNWLIAHWSDAQPALQRARSDAKPRPLAEVKLLPPVPAPPHVFAAPANYQKHIGELGDRVVTKK